MTVIYFALDQTAVGRKKRRGDWIYHTEQRKVQCGSEYFTVIIVYLPVFCRKKKKWNEKEWLAYFHGIPIPEENSRIRYHWQEETNVFMGRSMEPLSSDWIFFLLSYYRISFTKLVILDDRDMPTEELVQFFVTRTRSIQVVTGDRAQYEELSEALYQEFGFLLSPVENVGQLHLTDDTRKELSKGIEEKLLVIAGKNLWQLSPSMLPKGTIWLSTETENTNENRISRRADIQMIISMQTFWEGLSINLKI